jgi:hypothetical protein
MNQMQFRDPLCRVAPQIDRPEERRLTVTLRCLATGNRITK